MNLFLKKKWKILNQITEDDKKSLIDIILQARGIETPSAAINFLQPELKIIHDPFLLSDMQTACQVILSALRNETDILIFGDYDVDGVTATSILLLFFKSIGAKVSFHIPDRLTEGYGLSTESLKKIISVKPGLIITVDNGIAAVDEISQLQEAGIDVIVTDHHECKEVLPKAIAVINPKRPNSAYPFRDLAGAGVALKLVQALGLELGIPDAWKQYVGICALGTIGDIVPVVDENRMFIIHGIEQINAQPECSVYSLYAKTATAPGPVTATGLGYVVAPRINAAGRMGDCKRAVYLLTADSSEARDRLVNELIEENSRRQEVEAVIFEEAKEMIRTGYDFAKHEIIVVYKEGWHPGVLGIVASKLAEFYCRTVIVFGGDEVLFKGSGRSGDAMSVLDAIQYASDCVLQFGGHKKAAGLSVEKNKINMFIDQIHEFSKSYHGDASMDQEVIVDYEIPISMLSLEDAITLNSLEPFGDGNPQPVFICTGLKVMSIGGLSGGKHTKLFLESEQKQRLEAVAFGKQTNTLPFAEADTIDIVFVIKINEWRGKRSIQAMIKDLRKTPNTNTVLEEEQQVGFETTFENNPESVVEWVNGQANNSKRFLPMPDDFGPVYKFLLGRFSYESVFCDTSLLSDIIISGCNVQMSSFKLNRMLDVFAETGLVELRRLTTNKCIFRVIQTANRISLTKSTTYQRLCAN